MALSQYEKTVLDSFVKQGGASAKEDYSEWLNEYRNNTRHQQQAQQQKVTAERNSGIESGDIEPESFSEVTQAPKKDFISNVGSLWVKEGQEETTQVTGTEVPFTEESQLAENFIPSLKKEGGAVIEMFGSPIESTKSILSFGKSLFKTGMEASPIFKHLVEKTETDQAIEDSLKSEAAIFRKKVEDKGLLKVGNEAFQENPLLFLSIVTSPALKLGRLKGLTDKDLKNIKSLEQEAQDKIGEFVNPTTKANKQLTNNLAPELIERIKNKEIKPGDRETIKAFTESQVDTIGNDIGEFIAAGKVKGELDFDSLVKVLVTEDSKLRIDGNIIPGGESQVRFINAQLDFLGELQKAYGKNLPPAKQLELRRKYDVVFDKTITRDKITKFQDELQVTLADVLRKELGKNNPDLAQLNKDFSFYKGLDFVLEETLERKTGQSSTGLIAELRKQSQGTVGAVIGGTVGAGVGGPLGAAVGALFGGAVGARITKVLANPKYRLVDAKKKQALADAIASGDKSKVEKVLDTIIIAEAVDATKVEQESKNTLIEMLKKEAPETLVAPVRSNFVDDKSYQTALAKFKKDGNWATPTQSDLDRLNK